MDRKEIDSYVQDCLLTDLSWLDYYDIPVSDDITADDLRLVNIQGIKLQCDMFDKVCDFTFVGTIDGYFNGDEYIENYFEVWAKTDKVIGGQYEV